ncbi:hypothetical protein Cni_G14352 [Canna indica]|uniref:Uncharacterized protein n=1 Tax=Canna indica TaxID=4628 RepID=A0AAQ3QDW4_9LILI|nr:hypothetical protein Cni_G14352 [Canna indica]
MAASTGFADPALDLICQYLLGDLPQPDHPAIAGRSQDPAADRRPSLTISVLPRAAGAATDEYDDGRRREGVAGDLRHRRGGGEGVRPRRFPDVRPQGDPQLPSLGRELRAMEHDDHDDEGGGSSPWEKKAEAGDDGFGE